MTVRNMRAGEPRTHARGAGRSSTEILVASYQPLWPPVHGGRIRTARLAEAVGRHLDVCVLAPASAPPPTGLEHEQLPDEPVPGKLAAFASPRPAVARMFFGPRRQEALVSAVRRRRPGAVIFAQSYLAAVAPPLEAEVVIDFADVEVRRMASMSRRGRPRKRLAWGLEWAKAALWEPAVARRAALAVAITDSDAALLSAWGANVVCVPHGADRLRAPPSPPTGPVTFVGNLGYGPNLDGARFLIEQVWPRVRDREPGIALRIVGWGAERCLGRAALMDGIEVVSDVADVRPFYAQAALVVAPVREGGGAQVKVAEALGSRRTVVATPFSLRSVPPEASGAVLVAGGADHFAELVLRLWRDVDERRAREGILHRPVVPSWDESAVPLVAGLEALLR